MGWHLYDVQYQYSTNTVKGVTVVAKSVAQAINGARAVMTKNWSKNDEILNIVKRCDIDRVER